MALDAFLKEVNFFKEEDLKTKSFSNFVRQLSQNIIAFNNDANIYKTAKFLDWFNIPDKNPWYNLEKVTMNRREFIKPDILLKTLDHFSHQNEGSNEFYDMYQYLFWSDTFKNVNNSEFISLGYNLFLTKQGILKLFNFFRLYPIFFRLLSPTFTQDFS